MSEEDILDALPVAPLVEALDDEEFAEALPAPRLPQPGFWMSLLWCILFLMVTQTPGSVVAIGEMMIGLPEFARQEREKQQKLLEEQRQKEAAEGIDDTNRPPPPKPPPVTQVALDLFESDLVRQSLLHALAITEVCVIVFSFVVIRLVIGADWKRKLAVRRPGLAHTVLAVLGLPALAVVASGVYAFLTEVCGVPGMEGLMKQLPGMGDAQVPFLKTLMDTIKSWPLPLAILIIGVGPGIGEELWCRGFLGRGLVGRYGVVVGIAMTSFFFGLIHLDPAQGLMAMFMGVCLHYAYLTTRSLWVSILLHFMNNSLSVVALRIPALDAIEKQPEHFMVLFLGSALLVAAIGYAFYESRARIVPLTGQTIFRWAPDSPGVEYPPEGSGAVVTHPWPGVVALSGVAVGLVAFSGACWLAFS